MSTSIAFKRSEQVSKEIRWAKWHRSSSSCQRCCMYLHSPQTGTIRLRTGFWDSILPTVPGSRWTSAINSHGETFCRHQDYMAAWGLMTRWSRIIFKQGYLGCTRGGRKQWCEEESRHPTKGCTMAANVDVMLPLEIVALLVQLTHKNVLNKYFLFNNTQKLRWCFLKSAGLFFDKW